MVIIISSAIDFQIRGYITRFLYEISTGVYIGKLSRRVSDLLWDYVSSVSGTNGSLIMIRTTDTEQGYEIMMHNSKTKQLLSLDGLLMVEKLNTDTKQHTSSKHWSKARWKRHNR